MCNAPLPACVCACVCEFVYVLACFLVYLILIYVFCTENSKPFNRKERYIGIMHNLDLSRFAIKHIVDLTRFDHKPLKYIDFLWNLVYLDFSSICRFDTIIELNYQEKNLGFYSSRDMRNRKCYFSQFSVNGFIAFCNQTLHLYF